jgi:hypothetical protein
VLQRVCGRRRGELTAGGQNWVSRFVLSADGASTRAGHVSSTAEMRSICTYFSPVIKDENITLQT